MKILSTIKEEVGISSPFGGSVSSDERQLAVDAGVFGSSAVPDWQFVPHLYMVVREGEEFVRRAVAEVEASVGWAEDAGEGRSFMDIMGDLEKETGVESEGFTFADILQRAELLSETVLDVVVDIPDLPLC